MSLGTQSTAEMLPSAQGPARPGIWSKYKHAQPQKPFGGLYAWMAASRINFTHRPGSPQNIDMSTFSARERATYVDVDGSSNVPACEKTTRPPAAWKTLLT